MRWACCSYRLGCLTSVNDISKALCDNESFLDNAAANALQTREYRAPYVVPERV